MKMMKLLCTVVLFMLCGIIAHADNIKYDGLVYQLINTNDSTDVILTGIETESDSINIPDTIIYTVAEKEYKAYVRQIKSYVFQNRTLRVLTIPASLSQISYYAFNKCSIQKLYISSIKDWCGISFGGTDGNPLSKSQHLYITGNTEEQTDIVIPDDVTSIASYAFEHFTGLTSIELPSSLTSIGLYAFNGCDHLQTVTFNNIEHSELYNIQRYAFAECKALEEFTFPAGVINIMHHSFDGCSQLKNVTFKEPTVPEQAVTKYIYEYAFAECKSLTKISIPADLVKIEKYAFSNCSGLKEARFKSLEDLCKITFENKEANPLYYAHRLYFGDKSDDESTIDLTTLPQNVTAIGKAMFAGGNEILTVKIPKRITYFGADAFHSCDNIKTVEFADDEQLLEMTYENEAASPFKKGGNITTATGNDLSEITINASEIRANTYTNCSALKRVILTSNVKTIGKGAFKNCSNLNEVEIQTSTVDNVTTGLTTIDNDAFSGCNTLSIINLPNTLETIGSQVFRDCWALETVVIPESVTTLDKETFMNAGLKSITINAHIGKIDVRMFSGCSNLKAVILSDDITAIESEAFKKCISLTAFPAGGKVRRIESYAFTECNGIEILELPTTTRGLAEKAFYKCANLKQIKIDSIPSAMNEDLRIYDEVFGNCEKLQDVFLFAKEAPYASANAFGGKKGINLYLDEKADTITYQKAPWTDFNKPVTMTPHYITYYVDTTIVNRDTIKTGTPVEVYQYKYTKPEGWIFSGWQEKIPTVMEDQDYDIHGYFTIQRKDEKDFYYRLDPLKRTATLINHKSYKTLKDSIIISTSINSTVEESAAYNNSEEFIYAVKALADGAFKGDSLISSVTIPNSVDSIGQSAFANCAALISVKLPESIKLLSDSLFYECRKLNSVENMNGVIHIGKSAFHQCRALNLETLPSQLKNIGDLAFCYCQNISGKLTIPASVETMGERAFLNCERLEEVVFSNELKDLPASTFQNCYKLKSFTLPAGIKNIKENAFTNCRSIDFLEIPTGVQIVSDYAFSGCSNIAQVVIPETVQSLGSDAFRGCTKVTQFTINRSTPPGANSSTFDEELYTTENKATLYVPNAGNYTGKTPWKNFNIVNRVNRELQYLVDGKTDSIQTLFTGDVIAPIPAPEKEGHSFSGWRNLPKTMPDSNIVVTGAFKYQITYKTADKDSILYCDSLYYGDKIVAPAALDSVGCTYSLEPEIIDMPDSDVVISVSYLVAETERTIDNIRYHIYTQGENPHAEIMPGQTPYNIQSVSIPGSVPYMGVDYPVTVIRNDAFKDCTNLTNVRFQSPSNIQQIGTQAFNNCNKLRDIEIPKSVEKLGNESFMRCGSLETVTFEENSALTTILGVAFMGCSSLKEIEIPESVDSIGQYAFQYCYNLSKITINNSSKLPKANENTFEEVTYNNASLYTSVANPTEPWDKFKYPVSAIEIGQCDPVEIKIDASNKLVMTCTTEGATIVTSIQVQDVQESETTVIDKDTEIEIELKKKFTVTAYAKKFGMRRSETVSKTFNYEDINLDGKVNTADATAILKMLVE